MLNELKVLSDSIRAAGISGEEWDDKFKEIKVKGSPCFIVSISDKGEITDIRFLAPEKVKVLRTWQGGSNGECFPSFNLLPYYELNEDKKSPLTPSQKSTAIKTFVETFLSSNEPPTAVGRIVQSNRGNANKKTTKCLGTIADSFFKIVADGQPSNDPFVRLRVAVSNLRAGSCAESFNRKMLAYLRRHITEDMAKQKDPPTLFSILFKKSLDVVLFFDLADPGASPIASEVSMGTINAKLLTTKGASPSSPKGAERDAFGNAVSAAELSDKLPEVKLPGVLANTKLRSMSGESKCQIRYGRVDAESFPVGDEVRKAAKSALAWISSPEREGKTWAIAGASELVFAYPKSMPKAPPLLARLFGNGRSSAEEDAATEARFEEYAKAALSGIKSLSQGVSPNTEIEVFAIKKADTARRKVVFYRNYSLGMLEKAVGEWLAGARNIPDIRFRKWPRLVKGEKAKKGTMPVSSEFCAPLPLATVGLAYEVWSQDGNEKTEPKFRSAALYEGVPVFDGLELFLGAPAMTGLAQRMLSLLLQNSSGLCAAAGNLSHRPKDNVIANGRAASYLETALPLVGILLHKLNHPKETYMENAPYLIGRFLNLADGLHAVWCRNVKEKDPLPPQLLGSSLFASFQINPVQAFAGASLRLKPYLDWAKTNQTKDAALSRWFVGEFGRISAAIVKNGIPSRLSDTDKAEMLLGYLASSGKSDSNELVSSDLLDSPSETV